MSLENARAFIQRGRRGWADKDTWSLDWYVSEVLADALDHLRETSHGHPMVTGSTEPGEGSFGLWCAMLTVMADGMRAHVRILKMDYDTTNMDAYYAWERRQRKQFEAAWALMGHWWGALWS